MLVKQLTFMSGADGVGTVLGARVPMILTSDADKLRTRLASAAAVSPAPTDCLKTDTD
jgi:phosphate acetyltransferase